MFLVFDLQFILDKITDPWGTLLVIVDMLELKPLIDTDCVGSVKYD